GHPDAFLVEAGSGLATLGIPGSAGVPAAVARDTLTVPFNDLAAAEETMSQLGHTVAAVIVEPIACNVGLIPPRPGFLDGLRSVCDRYGSLLIFDEVITGFRVGLGGAQALYDVRPDLTTLGKIIGGGLPVGAYGGRRDVMEKVAPVGPVYQAGTLSGNPLAMAAGLATLEGVAASSFYERLGRVAERLALGLEGVLSRHGRPARVERIGSIFHMWFKANQSAPPHNYDDIRGADTERFARFFAALLARQVVIAPSAYEVGFVSAAHDEQHVATTIEAVEQALAASP
ncbi:MAG: aminotransferase class III-fold pyridoxal phosphate-dependent enzyme, partial [Deltaproteobacteria bacterium]|nr:aminotransferase class III-fold pyridoxal phosphate-dependent enzyme [Deltaproteobacteria bacterium]